MPDPTPETDRFIPAVTLHQPWASLAALGAKKFETRSWAPPIRHVGRRIAVHAGLRVAPHLGDETESAVAEVLGSDWRLTVPTGAVVCMAILSGAWRTGAPAGPPGRILTTASRDGSPPLTSFASDLFGDYSEGRWIWGLDAVARLDNPVPTRGKQGFWHWRPEDSGLYE